MKEKIIEWFCEGFYIGVALGIVALGAYLIYELAMENKEDKC